MTLAYRGHADDVVREGAIAPLIALLRVSADGNLRGKKQSTPPFWDEYWRDRERGCQPSGLAGWRRGYGSAAGALSALAAASEEFAAAIVAAGGMCFVLPRDGDGDGDDDDARMAEDATPPPATAGGCVGVFGGFWFRRRLCGEVALPLLLPYVSLCLFKSWKEECKPISYLE